MRRGLLGCAVLILFLAKAVGARADDGGADGAIGTTEAGADGAMPDQADAQAVMAPCPQPDDAGECPPNGAVPTYVGGCDLAGGGFGDPPLLALAGLGLGAARRRAGRRLKPVA